MYHTNTIFQIRVITFNDLFSTYPILRQKKIDKNQKFKIN